MLPYHDENETQRTPVVTMTLIALNVAAFVMFQGAGAERTLHRLGALVRPGAEDQFAGKDMHRLVLHVMVLAREDVPRLHVQHLADVAIGVGPDELVPPGLLDAPRNFGHHDPTG